MMGVAVHWECPTPRFCHEEFHKGITDDRLAMRMTLPHR